MRTLEATDKILKEGVAKIVLIGNEETIKAKAAEGGFDISGATIVEMCIRDSSCSDPQL